MTPAEKTKIRIFAASSLVGATVAGLATMPYNLIGWSLVATSVVAIFDLLKER